jgi:hypothetical protein
LPVTESIASDCEERFVDDVDDYLHLTQDDHFADKDPDTKDLQDELGYSGESAPLYTITLESVGPDGKPETRVVSVDQFITALYRPLELDPYSFLEVVMLTRLIPRPKESDKDKPSSGRSQNAWFELDRRHPLASSHVLQLVSKCAVPVLAGRPPPTHPGPRTDSANWQSKATWWAVYWATLLLPLDRETGLPRLPNGKVTYESFCAWLQSTTSPHASYEDRWRRLYMESVSTNLRVCSEAAQLLSRYRRRMCTPWSREERIKFGLPCSLGENSCSVDCTKGDREWKRRKHRAPARGSRRPP